jgi:hypothetical protein
MIWRIYESLVTFEELKMDVSIYELSFWQYKMNHVRFHLHNYMVLEKYKHFFYMVTILILLKLKSILLLVKWVRFFIKNNNPPSFTKRRKNFRNWRSQLFKLIRNGINNIFVFILIFSFIFQNTF